MPWRGGGKIQPGAPGLCKGPGVGTGRARSGRRPKGGRLSKTWLGKRDLWVQLGFLVKCCRGTSQEEGTEAGTAWKFLHESRHGTRLGPRHGGGGQPNSSCLSLQHQATLQHPSLQLQCLTQMVTLVRPNVWAPLYPLPYASSPCTTMFSTSCHQ